MSTYNIDLAAKWILNADLSTHVLGFGDSQMSDTTNYFGTLGLIKTCPRDTTGLVASSLNSAATVPSRGLLSGTNVTATNIVNTDTGNDLGVTNSTGYALDACTRLTFTADLGTNDGLGNGVILNGMNYNGTTTIGGYDWRLTQPSGRSWFQGRSVRAKVVHFDSGTAETMPYRFLIRRVGIGAGATTASSAYTNVTPTGINGFSSSAWSPELADAGNLSPSNNNDHEIRTVLEANGGNEATAGAFIIPHKVVYQAMASTGVPAKGITWDLSGRGGMSAGEAVSLRGTQATWTSRFQNTVTSDRMVIISMLGHNVEAAEKSGSLFTQAFIDNIVTVNNRLLNAARAVVGAANVQLICVCPWMYTVSGNGMDSLTAADSADTQLEAVSRAQGWGFVSLHRLLGRSEPFRNDLHGTQSSPQTPQNAVMLGSIFWRAMQDAAAASKPLIIRRGMR